MISSKRPRVRLGEIFVRRGIITETTLERALARSRRLDQKLGFTLEDMDVVTDIELSRALADQFGYKIARDFARLDFEKSLLKLVTVDMAMENFLFPLRVEEGKLAMAMADPTDTRIVENLAVNTGLKIFPFVATRRDIIAAINRHYLGEDPSVPKERTILVVEDNKLIATMVRDILTREGYRVLVAEDGFSGYKMAISKRPHLIITDKEMPKLDGFGLFDSLRQIPDTKDIPIFLLTGRTDGEEEAKAFEKGFYEFLTKPVREVTLKVRVRRAFQQLERARLFSFEPAANV